MGKRGDKMRIIYITESILREAQEKATFFKFKNKLIAFLKQLLSDPSSKEYDDFFKERNIPKRVLIKKLLDKKIIEKKEKIDEEDGKSVYHVQYKVPKSNFNTKIRHLYASLFERKLDEIDNMISNGMTQDFKYPLEDNKEEEVIEETDCASVGAIGDGSDSSGQFLQPMASVQRRSIYNPKANINKKKKTK